MNLVDLKYCGILSTRLSRYNVKRTSPYKANFRCPICGDSQKSKTLSRGWLLEKPTATIFYCFNCGASYPLWKFLKVTDLNLYNEYTVDSKLENYKKPVLTGIDKIVSSVPKFKKTGSPLLTIKKISQLPINHPARLYIDKRLIPTKAHFRLYYATKFNTWVNSIIPDKLPVVEHDNPRLILPFIKDGVMFGFQGRAFNKTSLRYITIMLDDTKPKVFGLDEVDFNRPYYVLEGPIDSLFLTNAIAMAGADIDLSVIENLSNAVFVLDNEPRNANIIARMESLVDRGYKVCVWPSHIKSKDINDMILAGLTSSNIESIIEANIFSGLTARCAIAAWRHC